MSNPPNIMSAGECPVCSGSGILGLMMSVADQLPLFVCPMCGCAWRSPPEPHVVDEIVAIAERAPLGLRFPTAEEINLVGFRLSLTPVELALWEIDLEPHLATRESDPVPHNFHRLIGPVHELMTLYDAALPLGEYAEVLARLVAEGNLVDAFKHGLLTDEECVTKLIVDLERRVTRREWELGRDVEGWTTVFANGEQRALLGRLQTALLATLSELGSTPV